MSHFNGLLSSTVGPVLSTSSEDVGRQSANPSSPDDPLVWLPAARRPRLKRVLGTWTAVSLVVGSVIGSGIFAKPGTIAQQLGDCRLIFAVWILGGVLCILGGLCFAELAAMMPGAGGMYVYLRRAYGPLGGFLFGWNEVLFNKPASTGALSVFFADSMARAMGWHLTPIGTAAAAILVVVLIAMVNVRGVSWGGAVQNATTAIKVAFLILLGVLPFLLTLLGASWVSEANFESRISLPPNQSMASRLSVALLGVMWAYNGWHGITPVAEEIRKPRRNIVRALIGGIFIVMALYLLANLAYHGVLSMTEVAQSGDHTAEHMLQTMLGPMGIIAITAVIACSTFGAINSDLLGVPRISFAMARDGLFLPHFAKVHPTFFTPSTAILAQAMLSSLLVVGSSMAVQMIPGLKQDSIFTLLTNFAIFTASVFYLMAVAAVPILRWRQPVARRPFRAWGYPATPTIFVLVYLWFLTMVFLERPFESQVGIGLILLGLPAFWIAARSRTRT